MNSVEAPVSVSLVEHEDLRRPRAVEPRRILGIGDEQPGARSRRGGARSRRRRRAPTSRAGSRRASRRRRRSPPSRGSAGQDDRDAVSPRHAPRRERVSRLVGEVLQLAPVELAHGAVEALPDHRSLVARMPVADVGGDVVPRRHLPAMGRAQLVVALLCSRGSPRPRPRQRAAAARSLGSSHLRGAGTRRS